MAKEEGVTNALLDEVERNVEQMTELSLAFTRAAAAAWTQGLRSTIDAVGAAIEEVSPDPKKKQDSRTQIARIGRGMRELAHRASISYGDALREGSARYLAEVERVIGTKPPAKSTAARKAKARRKKA